MIGSLFITTYFTYSLIDHYICRSLSWSLYENTNILRQGHNVNISTGLFRGLVYTLYVEDILLVIKLFFNDNQYRIVLYENKQKTRLKYTPQNRKKIYFAVRFIAT